MISKLLLAVALLAQTNGVLAQNREEESDSELTRPGKAAVLNMENRRIFFAIRQPEKPWVRYSLEAHETKEFPCKSKCYFAIKSESGTKEFVLRAKERYGVIWDEKNRRWAVGDPGR